jgi:hypothetical protein
MVVELAVHVWLSENVTVKLAVWPTPPVDTALTTAYPFPNPAENVNTDMGNTMPTTIGPDVIVPVVKFAVVVAEPVVVVTPVIVAEPVDAGGIP